MPPIRKIFGWVCLVVHLNAAAYWPNGEFNEGLARWTAQGDVTVSAGTAQLGDRSGSGSRLYQVLRLGGPSVLSFEWNGILSPVVPLGRAPDTFFATLYFLNQRDSFSPTPGGFQFAQQLLDQDRDGVSLVTGTTTPGSRAGWTRFSLNLDQRSSYVAPVFELFGDNLIGNDSVALLDHMKLLPVNATIFRIGFTNTNQTVVVDFEQYGGTASRYQLQANANPVQANGWTEVSGAVITELEPGVFRAVAPRSASHLLYRIGAAGPRITGITPLPSGEIRVDFQDAAHAAGDFVFEATPHPALGWTPVSQLEVISTGPGLFSARLPAGTPNLIRVVIP